MGMDKKRKRDQSSSDGEALVDGVKTKKRRESSEKSIESKKFSETKKPILHEEGDSSKKEEQKGFSQYKIKPNDNTTKTKKTLLEQKDEDRDRKKKKQRKRERERKKETEKAISKSQKRSLEGDGPMAQSFRSLESVKNLPLDAPKAANKNWSAAHLEGGDSRKSKFLRLLGAGVAAAKTIENPRTKESGEAIRQREQELKQQFEAGVRMKHEGSRRKGLGA